MLLRKASIENVRSFLDRAELRLDGQVCILVGPNGGGKTNLLDTIVTILRKYILASGFAAHSPTPENPSRYEYRQNDVLNNMKLDKHVAGMGRAQIVELELQVTERDIANMNEMKNTATALGEKAKQKYFGFDYNEPKHWTLDGVVTGSIFSYSVVDGQLKISNEKGGGEFLRYLQLYEIIGRFREEYGYSALSSPMLYLPVNRAAGGFSTQTNIFNFNEFEQKRHNDAILSRSGGATASLAVGKIADKYHMLLQHDNGRAKADFQNDANIKEISRILRDLGYEWELVLIDFRQSQYDIRLKKQGTAFSANDASSGERELLVYIFVIFALNVRDALIVVDEPELHLHPQWQKVLLSLFIELSISTGNQFLLATHSPTFISPGSIQFVSRVFSKDQKSHIQGMDTSGLPDAKHLLSIVNSQNNEKMFFADEVVLVEGVSDRIVFEKLLDKLTKGKSARSITEVVDVGGKHLFAAYVKLLRACNVNYSIVADLDYIDIVGTVAIKALLKTNPQKIKDDVLQSAKSKDADALVLAIDKAIQSGDWAEAAGIWDYIKSFRVKLRTELSVDEEAQLERFLSSQAAQRTFILKGGSLEDYLPNGLKKKDLEKLIEFLDEPDWWERLSEGSRCELGKIGLMLLHQKQNLCLDIEEKKLKK